MFITVHASVLYVRDLCHKLKLRPLYDLLNVLLGKPWLALIQDADVSLNQLILSFKPREEPKNRDSVVIDYKNNEYFMYELDTRRYTTGTIDDILSRLHEWLKLRTASKKEETGL